MSWMLVGMLLLSWLFASFATDAGSLANLLLVAAAAVVVYTLDTRGRIAA